MAGERQTEGLAVSLYPVDVADFDSCAELTVQVEAEVGPIEILVNNAGITRDAVVTAPLAYARGF